MFPVTFSILVTVGVHIQHGGPSTSTCLLKVQIHTTGERGDGLANKAFAIAGKAQHSNPQNLYKG